MIYKWKDTVHPNVDANVAADVCNSLESQGRLTAKDLVEESKPADAPLHGAFEWDNNKAAELYREGQARNIINCLTVTYDDEENREEKTVRAFFKISKETHDYESTVHIVSDEEKYQALLDMAKKELLAFKTKYAALKELDGVFNAITDITA